MNITLGFSPCPNDTFIFDALVNNKIDTKGFQFNVQLEDVQTLNQMAITGQLDISKISYGVLSKVLNKYIVLNSGSALGSGVGPLLISNKAYTAQEIEECAIAIPGEDTTAHRLFTLAYPGALKKVFIRYDEIENFLLESNGEMKAGVIIHENRFTYQDKGLIKIVDLGEYWEEKTGAPIPLGGIIAKRSLGSEIIKTIDSLIKESVQFAYSNYPALNEYITSHAQEMSEDVMRKHIDLYVNEFSIDLGIKGRDAINYFLSTGKNLPADLSDYPVFA